jgi:hypothetical protein
MATLAAIHHDLSNKMSTSTLQQFVSNEVEQNTQSLLNSLSILDEQLQRVQHDSGIRARFYNDPVGDWKINDQPELLPPSASDLLHNKQDATLTYLEFAQRPRRNTNTNTNTNTTYHTHHKRRNTPPPPPPPPPPPQRRRHPHPHPHPHCSPTATTLHPRLVPRLVLWVPTKKCKRW